MSRYPLLIPPPPHYGPEIGYLLEIERDRINAKRAEFAMDLLIEEKLLGEEHRELLEHVKHELLALESCYTVWYFSRDPSSTANYEMAKLKVIQSLK